MSKRKPSTKKAKKKIESYLRLIDEHEVKITETKSTEKLLESIPKMQREIAAFEKNIEKETKRLKRRKKRGTKKKK